MHWDLIVTRGPAAGNTFSVSEGEIVTIGRSRTADIQIDDTKISRIHCSVSVTGGVATIKDLGSRNGTYLNKHKIDSIMLSSGDMLYMGKTIIECEAMDTQSSTMLGAKMVGPYRLKTRIGLGGMAAVYLAEKLPERDTYAIKVLKSTIAADTELLMRFKREAKAGRALNHPNIVRIIDIAKDGPINYIVMEFCPGENLADILDREEQISVPRALRIASQVNEALRHAFRHDIVHRDIKPENIIVSKGDMVKVTDFGLAKFLDQTTEEYLTHTGDGLGTLSYLPPEQIDKAKIADIRADIYSLGASLYHMIAGYPPVEKKSLADFFIAIRKEVPKSLRKLNPAVPKSVSNLVDKCIAKRAKDRFNNPDDLATALRLAIEEVGS